MNDENDDVNDVKDINDEDDVNDDEVRVSNKSICCFVLSSFSVQIRKRQRGVEGVNTCLSSSGRLVEPFSFTLNPGSASHRRNTRCLL